MDLPFIQSLTTEHIIFGLVIYGGYRWMQNQQTAAKNELLEIQTGRHEAAKDEIKSALNNGIRDMVTKLNSDQDQRWGLVLDQKFTEHERREQISIREAIAEAKADNHACSEKVLAQLQHHDQRLAEVERQIGRPRARR